MVTNINYFLRNSLHFVEIWYFDDPTYHFACFATGYFVILLYFNFVELIRKNVIYAEISGDFSIFQTL